jgi:hypothetical protein
VNAVLGEECPASDVPRPTNLAVFEGSAVHGGEGYLGVNLVQQPRCTSRHENWEVLDWREVRAPASNAHEQGHHHPCAVLRLDALDDVVISSAERSSLTWLAGFEVPTAENIVAVITRARRTGGRPVQ